MHISKKNYFIIFLIKFPEFLMGRGGGVLLVQIGYMELNVLTVLITHDEACYFTVY